MRKHRTRPRKSRSDAQKAHALNLTALRIHHCEANSTSSDLPNKPPPNTSGNDAGPSASLKVIQLKKDINQTQRELKNAHQREKRAKTTVAQHEAELSRMRSELSEFEHRADSAEEALTKVVANTSNEIAALQQVNSHQRQQTAKASNQLCLQLEEEKLARHHAQVQLQTMEDRNKIADLAILDTTAQLASSEKKLEHLQFRTSCLEQNHNMMKKQLTRARVRLESTNTAPNVGSKAPVHQLSLKNPSGTIRPEVRNLLRQLAGDGVATEKIMDVIYHVIKTFDLTLTDSISARSVGRAVLEGLIQSQIQIAVEIDGTERLSICGDGTTIKNQNYEARLIRAPAQASNSSDNPILSPPPLRTLGVYQAPNHTAQTQLEGWKEAIATCCDLFRRSPLGQHSSTNNRTFAAKLSGMVTDHASDQKRLVELMVQWKTQSDRELRGEEVLGEMSIEARGQVLLEHLEAVKQSIPDWETLSADEQDQITQNSWSTLALSTGEDAFRKLPEHEKELATFFAWTGCCMHKELNAVKGGVKSMSAEWTKLNLTPPIELMNKHEAQNSREGTVQSRVTGGAVKLTILAGLIFHHHDDKRGHQDTYRFWFELVIGYLPTFPGTSSTRYGSHGDAAVELLVHLDHYLDFLDCVCDAGSGKLANIEGNVYNALKDPATLTELAVLGLYSQAVSKPYMRCVRGFQQNALELGVYHEKVKSHCRAIMENPHLLMAPSTGTLDGNEWEEPKLITKIKELSKELPHLYTMITSFFSGALAAWERFTQEFGAESAIGQASSGLRSHVWNDPTNDASEGALGQARQMLRRMPAVTENQRNGRVMWTKNDTQEFVKNNFTEETHAFVLREARALEGSGQAKKTRMKQIEAWKQRGRENKERRAKAEMRKSARKHSLASVQLLVDATPEELGKLTVKELDEQIDKIRDSNIPISAKSRLRKKAEKLAAVQQALGHWASTKDPKGVAENGMDADMGAPDEPGENSDEESGHLTVEELVSDFEGGMLPPGAADDHDGWEF